MGCALILMQGCLADPFQVELDSRLGEGPRKVIQEQKNCDYLLVLDPPSSRFTVTTYPDTWVGGQQQYIFPLGETLSALMSQAQQNNTGDRIVLQFQTSEFHFILGESYIAAVNRVSYQAHFKGPEPVGNISFPEKFIFTPAMDRDIDFPEKTFYAVSQALRATTIKLFDEVTTRVCGY